MYIPLLILNMCLQRTLRTSGAFKRSQNITWCVYTPQLPRSGNFEKLKFIFILLTLYNLNKFTFHKNDNEKKLYPPLPQNCPKTNFHKKIFLIKVIDLRENNKYMKFWEKLSKK